MTQDLREALEEQVEEWREKPGLYRKDMITDQMHYATRKECANDIEELLQEHKE